MLDVLIVGAGPSGATAATVLARAGARVLMVDRARFPRDKLCGDTLNPGTLAILRRLGMAACPDREGLPIDGMLVTGEARVSIRGRYPHPLTGRAISRRDLDAALVREATAAGAAFDSGVTVQAPFITAPGRETTIGGVWVGGARRARAVRARVTIAADGRRSVLAFALGLARHPERPRRWAIGAYFDGVTGLSSVGEMHVRRSRYIGVSPQPGGAANVCLVIPSHPADRAMASPAALLDHAVHSDPLLRGRFASARLMQPPVVLGPLAVDVRAPAPDGLLLAGDAAGFVDPITGDGLRFAIRGGELAAEAALQVLAHGWEGVQTSLRARRVSEFGPKWRFNRMLRVLVGSPQAVTLAAAAARLFPPAVRAIITRAGDCELACAQS